MDEILLGLGTLLFASWRLPATSDADSNPESNPECDAEPVDPPGASGPGVP